MTIGAAGIALEATLGAGLGDGDVVGVWGFGVLYSFYLLGVGVSFQFPLTGERPSWLEVNQFAVRFRLPLEGARTPKSAPSRAPRADR